MDQKKEKASLERILEIMAQLRGEGGCPWDKEQTHESLKRYLIEEAYEVAEAVDADDMDKLCDELGDVLLQVVFHAQIGKESHDFDIFDVLDAISEKMIRRHPHVFGEVKNVDTSDKVLSVWESIKAKENGGDKPRHLMDMPKNLPALLRAQKIQEKAALVGFDWPDVSGVWSKVEEEMAELLAAASGAGQKEELGDLLFALVNLARFLGINAEEALAAANNKFVKRFEYVDNMRQTANKKWHDMDLPEMEQFWQEAKKNRDFVGK